MHFQDFTRDTDAVRVIVAADALQTLWGEETGPQTADELVEAHWSLLASIVHEKVAGGDLEEDGSVPITEGNLEGDEDGVGGLFVTSDTHDAFRARIDGLRTAKPSRRPAIERTEAPKPANLRFTEILGDDDL